jgi:hypothetical protein
MKAKTEMAEEITLAPVKGEILLMDLISRWSVVRS